MKPLSDLLKRTANRIENNKSSYNWKAIGACNCGNLVQEVTGYSAKEISRQGIQKHGDWWSLSELYLPESHFEIDNTIGKLINFGIELEDLRDLEQLSNPKILAYLQTDRLLIRDNPDDCIKYLNAWSEMVENELI